MPGKQGAYTAVISPVEGTRDTEITDPTRVVAKSGVALHKTFPDISTDKNDSATTGLNGLPNPASPLIVRLPNSPPLTGGSLGEQSIDGFAVPPP